MCTTFAATLYAACATLRAPRTLMRYAWSWSFSHASTLGWAAQLMTTVGWSSSTVRSTARLSAISHCTCVRPVRSSSEDSRSMNSLPRRPPAPTTRTVMASMYHPPAIEQRLPTAQFVIPPRVFLFNTPEHFIPMRGALLRGALGAGGNPSLPRRMGPRIREDDKIVNPSFTPPSVIPAKAGIHPFILQHVPPSPIEQRIPKG